MGGKRQIQYVIKCRNSSSPKSQDLKQASEGPYPSKFRGKLVLIYTRLYIVIRYH